MSTNLSIILKRANKIYHEGESIVGVVLVESTTDVRQDGLSLVMKGAVNLQLSPKHSGIFETFSNSIKPITLINTNLELSNAGKIAAGRTEIPFEMPLQIRASPGHPGLLETYHGVFISVMYTLQCTMKRSFLNKPLNTSTQFFVQYRPQEPPPLKPVRCEITPSSVRWSGRHSMPHFHMYAEIDTTVCPLDKPVTGKIRIDECSVPVKSVELQLVRVETCGCQEGYSRDATEIQNIQAGWGLVERREIPLYAVLPRYFTCPTTTSVNFKIEFELNIAVIFEDDYLVTENFPILLVRSR